MSGDDTAGGRQAGSMPEEEEDAAARRPEYSSMQSPAYGAPGLPSIKREIISSKMGLAGIGILAALIVTSAVTMAIIPIETFQEWNNPKSWISYPKTAVPAWVNMILPEKIPEHIIIDSPDEVRVQKSMASGQSARITTTTHEFHIKYDYDDFPSDFIYGFSAQYEGSPLLEVHITRPDGDSVRLISKPLPYADSDAAHSERIFSTDGTIRKNVIMYAADTHAYDASSSPTEDVLFASHAGTGGHTEVLRGTYTLQAQFHTAAGAAPDVYDSSLTVGGKAFGLMGTDELRRDLAVGLLWGTPLALFIGITVAVASVMAGLLYGVYAGYRGKKTDEAMMRFNDIIYALPALPFLIILSVTISSSILLMVGFLVLFGWVGVAKVARSMSLQIKTRGYVDAAEIMGQRRSVIITRHIIPQLLPYAFASIAISVPAAITTEAGLSFLGLGDPSFPTWGQILHDANTFGAAARGLWWWMMPPGVMIAITGLAFVFIGNALDSIVNPRQRGGRIR